MNDKISVIIPAYNVAPYLKRCVRSVMHQTYEDLEILLVDDGSTDETGQFCDELQEEDARVQVIHQKNQGLSAARNAGLNAATGDFIAFLDSDDWIEPPMYACLHDLMVEHEADIASCRTRDCILDQDPPQVSDSGEVKILDSEEMVRGLLDQKIVRFEVWNKLWRRSLIGDTRFIVGQVSEDVYFDRVLFLRANKMVHIEKTFHNYLIQRPGNTLSKFRPARMCVFDEFDALVSDLKKMGKDDTAELVCCIATAFTVTMYEQAFKTKQDKEIMKKLRVLFKKYYKVTKKSKYRSRRGKIAMLIFNISPRLFILLWGNMRHE